jgi:hypothetical protein
MKRMVPLLTQLKKLPKKHGLTGDAAVVNRCHAADGAGDTQ